MSFRWVGKRQVLAKVYIFEPYLVTDALSDIVPESTDWEKDVLGLSAFVPFRRMMPVAINVKSLPLLSCSHPSGPPECLVFCL